MALTFPANPTVGQTYISSDYTYAWDGVKWTSVKRQISNVFDTTNHMAAATSLRIGDYAKVLNPLSDYAIQSATADIPLDNGLNAREITQATAAPITQPRQTGDGVTTTFDHPAAAAEPDASFFVTIDGIYQTPTIAYVAAANGINFTEAPPSGAAVDVMYFKPVTVDVVPGADLSEGTVSAGGSVYRTLSDRFSDVIHAKDFGAVGDGVTDDTAALQSALIAAQDGVLVLSHNAKYVVTDKLGSLDCETLEIQGNGATFLVQGLTPEQLALEGDAARGWWYLDICLRIVVSKQVILNDFTFDMQGTFVYQTLATSGECYAKNVNFKDVRYPNGTFSNQWATSNEGCFVTSSGVNSHIDSCSWSNCFHKWFDGTLIEPNASGQFQARALALNGNYSNNYSTYSNLDMNECAIGVIIDGGSYLTFENCSFTKVRANVFYELGALNVKYLGCSFDTCDDQGITTYGSNILIQGCTFFNVKNRCVALRNRAKTRISIVGNTFRHQTTADTASMMCIGRPDGSGADHNIEGMIIANNIFDIQSMNYYIAELGPISGSLAITGNTIWYDNAITASPALFSFTAAVGSEDTLLPIITGNTFDSGDGSVCNVASNVKALIQGNSMGGKTPDGNNPSFRLQSNHISDIEGAGNITRPLEGELCNTEPRGVLHVKSQDSVSAGNKLGNGAYVTYGVETNIYSPFTPNTIGAAGYSSATANNSEPTARWDWMMSNDPSGTRVLNKVASVDRQGRYLNLIPGQGIVLMSPNGTSWHLTIDDTGTVATTAI